MDNEDRSSSGTTEASQVDDDASQCYDYEDNFNLAVWYSTLDIVNLSLGVFADLILYIGTKEELHSFVCRYSSQQSLRLNKICVIFFLVTAVVRELLHCTGTVIHVLRCSTGSYLYEFTVRLLCQYMIYGIWIAFEYFVWLKRGRLFVPRRGLMEPKTTRIRFMNETSTDTTIRSSKTVPSIKISPGYSSPYSSTGMSNTDGMGISSTEEMITSVKDNTGTLEEQVGEKSRKKK